MTRLTLSRLTQITANPSAAVDTINQNLEDIENAVEDTVSRSGQVPTYMTHELDMNSQRIINLGAPIDDNDAIRKIDAEEYKAAAEEAARRSEAAAATAALNAQEAEESAASAATSAAMAVDAADRAEAVLADPAFIEVSTDLLKGDDSEIRKVNANKENIDTVADNIEYVIATGDNIDKIIAVEADLDNIDAVVTNIANVNKVGQDINNVNAVANDLDNIDTVEANLTNIETVATNIQDVSTVADNIQDIKDAPEYAVLSKQYAVGEPSEPTEHSSKWWAQHAGLVPKGVYNASTTYGKNDLVYVDGGEIRTFYSSLQDSNTGHAVTEASWWLEMWSVTSRGTVAFANITGEVSDNPKLVEAFKAKQSSLDTTQLAAVNSGINTTKVTNYDTHIADTVIHVTAADKTNWNDKQDPTDNTLTTTDKTIVGAINELNSGTVKLTDDQTIVGTKTFINNPVLYGESACRYHSITSLYQQGTAPSTDIYGGFRLFDKNGVEMGTVFTTVSTTNIVGSVLYVKSPVAGSTANARMGIYCDNSGTFFTAAPTPETSDNSTQIATTAYVKSNLANTLKYTDKPTITGWGFPSDRYIDLAVGASGATYTAPANGYIYINANMTIATGTTWLSVSQGPMSEQRVYYSSNQKLVNLATCVLVRKGAFLFHYANMSLNTLRFIYAEGEK